MTDTTAPTTVFFGDSLSDDGNLDELLNAVLPGFVVRPITGPTDTFSDGPTFAEYAGDALGGESANYAFGSAEAVGSAELGDLLVEWGLDALKTVPDSDPILEFDINLSAQVDRFLDDTAGADLSSTTAFLLIGGNDFLAVLDGDPEAILTDLPLVTAGVVQSTVSAAAELAVAGVGETVVMTVPAPTYFPFSADLNPLEAALAVSAFEQVNALIEAEIAALAEQGLAVEILDITAITDSIALAPDAYGFLAPYDLTITEGAERSWDDEQVAFWDDVHPSTANHGIVGSFVAAVAEGAEVFEGGAGGDVEIGTEGVDIMLGNGGGDRLRGEGGDDVVNGHDGDDLVRGGAGADLVSGGSGADTGIGGAGADTIAGGLGDDILLGNGGADVLIDGLGSDLAIGGAGDDAFVWTEAALLGGEAGDLDVILGGRGHDTLYVVLTEESFAAHDGTLDAEGLGLGLASIEEIVVLEGLDALDEVENAPWSEDADLWGLI